MRHTKYLQVLRFAQDVILIAMTAALLWQCRPTSKNASKTQSLDNFANGTSQPLTENYCGANYTGSEPLSTYVSSIASRVNAPDADTRNAVIGVLAVMPPALMAPFFASGGHIEVTADASTKCAATPFTQAEKQLAGTDGVVPTCWQQAAAGQAPVLYLAPNTQLIRHSLVRLFAYVYTELFVERIQKATMAPFTEPAWQDAIKGFITNRESLAAAFLVDLQSRGQADSVQRLTALQNSDPHKFGNYVFAEAMDSYYCSATTRQTFSTLFHNTWLVFNDVSPHSPVAQFGSR